MIKLEHIYKAYGEKIIFHDFNLSLLDNKVYVLQGKNGIGKTTLLRILAGLEKYKGVIKGVNKVAMVFQEDRLIDDQSVLINLWLVLDKTFSEAKEIIEDVLKTFDLYHYKDQKISELSGGTRRKIAIIRALLVPCNLLLLDEPLKGLDQSSQDLFTSYFLQEAQHKTVVWVSHADLTIKNMILINL